MYVALYVLFAGVSMFCMLHAKIPLLAKCLRRTLMCAHVHSPQPGTTLHVCGDM